MNSLFLSYDGMTDPLGPSQVLPYVFGLAKAGHRMQLASLEKPGTPEADVASVRAECERAGVAWHPLRFRSDLGSFGAFANYRQLWRTAQAVHKATPINLIHARSYIPAMVASRMKSVFGTPFLFDMRGFWPDERVDGGLWPQDNPVYRLVYRYMKRREADLLASADAIISLTHAGEAILKQRIPNGPPITVIPCCADLDAFPEVTPAGRASARRSLGIAANATVAAYLGSVGTWYMLGEMLDYFSCELAGNPGARFLLVTRDPAEPILQAAAARSIPVDALIIRPAKRNEVAGLLAAADYGLFFIKPCFSKKASSPTKLGEFLALGLPVVTNNGVGDVDTIVRESGAGVLVPNFSPADYRQAVDTMRSLKREPKAWRDRARHWFDLDVGLKSYIGVYEALTRGSPAS